MLLPSLSSAHMLSVCELDPSAEAQLVAGGGASCFPGSFLSVCISVTSAGQQADRLLSLSSALIRARVRGGFCLFVSLGSLLQGLQCPVPMCFYAKDEHS